MLKETLSMSERLACKAVGLARSTYRRLPLSQTPTDPDAEMRAWLRGYATKHPCHGFRRAWAALRYDERREINKKKMSRLWREEGLQVRVHSPRKRAGISSVPPVEADAPDVVWAIDFQFDSTIDGKAIKIASMIDEHTRLSLLHVVERSAGVRVGESLRRRRRPAEGAEDGQRTRDGFPSAATVLREQDRHRLHSAGLPVGQRYIESFNNRLRRECLNRNHWNTLLDARVVIGDFKHEHNHRHRHSALGYRTPAEYAAACRHTHTPVACEIN
jgi:transposase InsO family protein